MIVRPASKDKHRPSFAADASKQPCAQAGANESTHAHAGEANTREWGCGDASDEGRGPRFARSCDIFDMGGDGDEAALLECHSDFEDEWEMPVAHEVNEPCYPKCTHTRACVRVYVRTYFRPYACARAQTHTHTRIHTHPRNSIRRDLSATRREGAVVSIADEGRMTEWIAWGKRRSSIDAFTLSSYYKIQPSL